MLSWPGNVAVNREKIFLKKSNMGPDHRISCGVTFGLKGPDQGL